MTTHLIQLKYLFVFFCYHILGKTGMANNLLKYEFANRVGLYYHFYIIFPLEVIKKWLNNQTL